MCDLSMFSPQADVPDWLHFRDDPRIYDIVLVCSNGYEVGGNDADHYDLYFPEVGQNETQEAQRQGAGHGFMDLSEGKSRNM